MLADWADLDLDKCRRWQEFLLTYGAPCDVESNNWMVSVLELSLDPSLKAAVSSDLESLPEQERGAITMLFLAIKRVVVRNQEGRDMLTGWIAKFDIRNYNNQDVARACLLIKAVVRAIGEDDLPSNTVRRIVTGMSKASNEDFRQLCQTSLAMLGNSLHRQVFAKLSITQHLMSILDDLETKYGELVTGKAWDGVGYEATSFLCHNNGTTGHYYVPPQAYNAFCQPTETSGHQTLDEYFEDRDKMVLLGKTPVPFSEWVKTATCHACGEKGHIAPQCPRRRRRRVSFRDERRGARDKDRGDRYNPTSTRFSRRPPTAGAAAKDGAFKDDRRQARHMKREFANCLLAEADDDSSDSDASEAAESTPAEGNDLQANAARVEFMYQALKD